MEKLFFSGNYLAVVDTGTDVRYETFSLHLEKAFVNMPKKEGEREWEVWIPKWIREQPTQNETKVGPRSSLLYL